MNKNILNTYTEIIHRAVQLITKASKSWLKEKADDSHTNVEWNVENESFRSHFLPKNIQLELSVAPFALNLLQNNSVAEAILLSGKKHSDIEAEMVKLLIGLGLDENQWNAALHFELPYTEPQDYTYPELESSNAQQIIDLRNFTQLTFEKYGHDHSVGLGLRTWPHHFDLGGLSDIQQDENGESTASIGMGLAMADSTTDEHYLYVNHWKKGGIEKYPNPTALPHKGYWLGNNPMAILRISDIEENGELSEEKALEFIDQAVKESARFVVLS
jgi:hypothetical protein